MLDTAAQRFLKEYFSDELSQYEIVCINVYQSDLYSEMILLDLIVGMNVYVYSLTYSSLGRCLMSSTYMRAQCKDIDLFFNDLLEV